MNSDPIVIKIHLRHFARVRKSDKPKPIDIKKLANLELRAQATENLEVRLQTTVTYNDIESRWNSLKKVVRDTQDIDTGYVQTYKKQQWMTDEILQLMGDRSKQKTRDTRRYKELNRAVRTECRRAKERWLADKCSEMGTLQKKRDLFNLHKNIKEFTNTGRKQCRGILRGANNKILVGVEEKLDRWKEYVELLYADTRPDQPPIASNLNDSSPDITKEEVKRAIELQKKNKAVGPDQFQAEPLKIIL